MPGKRNKHKETVPCPLHASSADIPAVWWRNQPNLNTEETTVEPGVRRAVLGEDIHIGRSHTINASSCIPYHTYYYLTMQI